MNRVLFSILAAGFAITAIFYANAQPTPAQPKTGPTEKHQFDPTGRKLEPGKEPVKVANVPTRKKAKFELYHETAVGFKWEIEVIFDPRVYPYKITGGKIVGTICGSPNWEVTGGSFGPGLIIKAKNTKPEPGCSEFVAITGSAINPSSYAGTYYFSHEGIAENPQNRHNTLFLGFAEP